MGKIKHTILAKQDRPAPPQSSPSVRRLKRQHMRGKQDHRTMVPQFIPDTIVLKLNKESQFRETVVHRQQTNHHKGETSSRRVTYLTAKVGTPKEKLLRSMAERGKGEIITHRRRTVWHLAGTKV